MINEPLIHKHYTDMPLSELESRSLHLDVQRQNIGKGQMPHGMSVYRRRLMKALETKRAEQAAQQEHYMHSEPRAFNTRLSAQQLYERGMTQGKHDGACGMRSTGNSLATPEERRGYHDGYRSVQAQRDW